MVANFYEVVIIPEVTAGHYNEIWALTSSHMNLIGLIESTVVSAFMSYGIYAFPVRVRDPSMQKHSNRKGDLHAKNCIAFAENSWD